MTTSLVTPPHIGYKFPQPPLDMTAQSTTLKVTSTKMHNALISQAKYTLPYVYKWLHKPNLQLNDSTSFGMLFGSLTHKLRKPSNSDTGKSLGKLHNNNTSSSKTYLPYVTYVHHNIMTNASTFYHVVQTNT